MGISDTNRWITRPKPVPRARLRVFCFPYAGGGASLFRAWVADFPPDVEVCPVQLPGRESRFGEPPFTSLPSLIEALGVAIEPYLDVPTIFLGHSMGAITAFELARYVRRQRLPEPCHLVVSAHRAPHLLSDQVAIHNLPDPVFLAELARLNGIPQEVRGNSDLMRLMMPLLRSDFSIAETYTFVAEAPLDCSLSIFGGLSDAGISRDAIAGWQQHTHAKSFIHMIPGDHFFFFQHRYLILRAIFQDISAGDHASEMRDFHNLG